jgi:hypothetical protein
MRSSENGHYRKRVERLPGARFGFHAFCNIFPQPMGPAGAGVQDLTAIGQKIVHAAAPPASVIAGCPAASTTGPVDLGSNVAEGSYYKNGEVTLEFKGIGVVNGAACALLGVDSGRGSFAMALRPAPNVEIKTTGGSRYKADIYVNLATHWVSRVDADETVESETILPTPPNKFDAVTERTICIRNVSAAGRS